MRLRDAGTLLWIYKIPLFGIGCIAAAIIVHLHHAGGDSAFEIALFTFGGGTVARSERATFRALHKRDDPSDEFLTGPKKALQRPKWADQ